MAFCKLITEATVNTRHGLMVVQVDKDLWMAKGWIFVAFTSDDSSVDDFRRHFCDQINRPFCVRLLFPIQKSGRTDVVIHVPFLSSVSPLVFAGQIALKRDKTVWFSTLVLRQFLTEVLWNEATEDGLDSWGDGLSLCRRAILTNFEAMFQCKENDFQDKSLTKLSDFTENISILLRKLFRTSSKVDPEVRNFEKYFSRQYLF